MEQGQHITYQIAKSHKGYLVHEFKNAILSGTYHLTELPEWAHKKIAVLNLASGDTFKKVAGVGYKSLDSYWLLGSEITPVERLMYEVTAIKQGYKYEQSKRR